MFHTAGGIRNIQAREKFMVNDGYSDKKTILIFQKPELYFFREFPDIVFSPFCVPERGFRYLIYKALYLLHIPWCSLFWGEWKAHIEEADQVIIFDYGYQRGMETYIKKKNPACKVSLFFWNIITDKQKNHLLFTDKSAIYSTDRGCCRKYHFRYNHIFYTKKYYEPYSSTGRNRLFFFGADKGRAEYLAEIKPILERGGLICDIRVSVKSGRAARRKVLADILTKERLDYPKYCACIRSAGVLLDVNQEGQEALSMRVLESVYFSKKLITTNGSIKKYSFYNPDNIFILSNTLSEISPEEIRAFIERPFVPYSQDILEEYDFAHWKDQF